MPPIDSVPLVVAIAILKSAAALDGSQRKSVETWAVDRLNVDPACGSADLLAFWGAALDAGVDYLDSLGRLAKHPAAGVALRVALDTLLATRPSMPAPVLQQAIRAARGCIEPSRLLNLALAALADSNMHDAQRRAWSVVAFALDPLGEQSRFEQEHGSEAGLKRV